jgi:phage virion morphogenesis protein
MAGANFIIDDSEVRKRLTQMRRVDRKALLSEIGEYTVSETQQRFRDSKGPDGKPWEPLAESTMISRIGGLTKSRKKRGGTRLRAIRLIGDMKPLVDRGHLRDSVIYRATKDHVAIGTNKIQGAIHQFGGMAGRGRKVKIPARPYLGFSAKNRRDIRLMASDFLARVAAGGAG